VDLFLGGPEFKCLTILVNITKQLPLASWVLESAMLHLPFICLGLLARAAKSTINKAFTI